MGGKRPDQHNIAPGEAGATDYKNLPQVGRGHGSLDDTVTDDKHQLAQSKSDLEAAGDGGMRGAPVPGNHPAPSKDVNRAAREGGASSSGEGDTMSASAGGGTGSHGAPTAPQNRPDVEGTEDPRERGVGA